MESESSTLTSENEEDETADASLSVPMNPAQKQQHQQLLHYHTQQHLYLTSRSLHLRQALIQHRGLTELALQQPSLTDSQQQPKVPIDWECAISTRTSPKSCLYALDAEVGAKVIAPALPLSSTDGEQEPEGSYQWITVSALNRLRRTDPSKVDPLWHNQYAILSTWFGNTNNNINNNNWSLYSHLPLVPGRVLSAILDQPIILTVSLIVSTLLSALIFWPILEGLVKWLLTSRLLWMYYSSWSRFVHAALPLKLLVAQMLYKAVWDALATVQAHVQSYLVDWECQLLQDHLPVTLLENEPDLKNSESYDVPGDDDDNNDGDDDEY